MTKTKDLQIWIEGTIIAAMGMVLSLIPVGNQWFDLSLGLVPLVLFSFRRGLRAGMMAGFLWGLLSIISGGASRFFISIPQIIFEYPFAFAFGGFGGLFASKIQQTIKKSQKSRTITYMLLGSILATFARFFWHFWAGIVVWGSYAPKGMSPYLYSFIVNGGSAVANAIYVTIVLLIIYKISPKLFVPK